MDASRQKAQFSIESTPLTLMDAQITQTPVILQTRESSEIRACQAGIGSEFGLSQSGGYTWRRTAQPNLTDRRDYWPVANGRAALGLAARCAKHFANDGRDTVLLPAYLCHSMIQPFAELGLKIRFYPVGKDLTIEPDVIRPLVNERTLVIVLMHYFGFCQSKDLADRLRQEFPFVTIIDDRTHLLLSDLKACEVKCETTVAVYSPRKWGPFPDLGIMLWPTSGASAPMVRNMVDRGYDLPFGFWRMYGLLLRAIFLSWPGEALRRFSLQPLRRADTLLDHRVTFRRASPISRWLWRHWDWLSTWQIRRKNYQYLLDNWPSSNLRPLFRSLPPAVGPLGFPIRAPERERLKAFLISKGIFCPIHWIRPPQVSPDEFPDAAALSTQELTIPIDQRYGQGHMDYILEAICRA